MTYRAALRARLDQIVVAGRRRPSPAVARPVPGGAGRTNVSSFVIWMRGPEGDEFCFVSI